MAALHTSKVSNKDVSPIINENQELAFVLFLLGNKKEENEDEGGVCLLTHSWGKRCWWHQLHSA